MFNVLISSKRFWVAVAALVSVLLREQLKLPITDDQVQQVVMVVAAWIVGDSLRATDPAKNPTQIIFEATNETKPETQSPPSS